MAGRIRKVGVVGTDIVIKPSMIPNAGRGVYTLRSFKEGDLVTKYEGDIIAGEEVVCSTYAFSMNSGLTLVGWSELIDWEGYGAAQLINDPICGFMSKYRINVYFHEIDNVLYARAIRDISSGEELYVSYGFDYWNCTSRLKQLKMNFESTDFSLDVLRNHLTLHSEFEKAFTGTEYRNGHANNCQDEEYYIQFDYQLIQPYECGLSDHCETAKYTIKFGSVREIWCRACNRSRIQNELEPHHIDSEDKENSDDLTIDEDECDIFRQDSYF